MQYKPTFYIYAKDASDITRQASKDLRVNVYCSRQYIVDLIKRKELKGKVVKGKTPNGNKWKVSYDEIIDFINKRVDK